MVQPSNRYFKHKSHDFGKIFYSIFIQKLTNCLRGSPFKNHKKLCCTFDSRCTQHFFLMLHWLWSLWPLSQYLSYHSETIRQSAPKPSKRSNHGLTFLSAQQAGSDSISCPTTCPEQDQFYCQLNISAMPYVRVCFNCGTLSHFRNACPGPTGIINTLVQANSVKTSSEG